MEFPIGELKKWFLEARRPLPWRENPSPYAVWVSEVMLQQTQAKVVIPYFERWMKRFPTLQDLARAEGDEVIKMWEGLGYYSRARHLHLGAKYIVEECGGRFPAEKEGIAKIKGVGLYTQGALLNFAFHTKAAACDGNVYRLLARFFALQEPIDQSATQHTIRQKVEAFLPEEEPWIVSEALIECGALICQKQPQCRKCPLVHACKAFSEGLTETLPRKKKGEKTIQLHRIVGVIVHEGAVLVKKGNPGKVMGELFEFPFAETQDFEEGRHVLEEEIGLSLSHVRALDPEKQTFTRYRVSLFPHLFQAPSKEVKKYEWKHDLLALPFSSGHRRILQRWVHT